jgi:hypothetical protein
MRNEKVTRKQTAILWLIHSEGFGGRQMRRKVIAGYAYLQAPKMLLRAHLDASGERR